jgi:hypothetical protein
MHERIAPMTAAAGSIFCGDSATEPTIAATRLLPLASTLHDIGKIGIADHILLNPASSRPGSSR